MPAARIDHEIIIIGAGFSGIGVAIELKRQGFDDFALLEKADEVGGTWRDNTYPGLAVDIPSPKYSFRFEPNPDWSRLYAPGPELQAYALHCAEKYRVRPRIRFGHSVERCVYDEESNTWRLELRHGGVRICRYLITATGIFGEPKLPEIKGLEDFEGKVIHTARWDHDHDLRGERVAVLGTGATAIQLVPKIVEQVAHLDIYQRTPIWLMPKIDSEISPRTKRIFRRFPVTQRALRRWIDLMNGLMFGVGFLHYKQFPGLFRWIEKRCVEHIREQVDDPAIQEKLIPDYSFFCKRPSLSNDYYPVFNRESVELVTEPIREIAESAVVTVNGKARAVDTLILATGYAVGEKGALPRCEIYGRDGVELGALWARTRYRAFHGVSVPSYPNHFMIFGPYATSSPSWFDVIDLQVRHITRCLREARRRHANRIEITASAHERDFAEMIRRRANTVLFAGSCASAHSYYFDDKGDTPLLRPVTRTRARLSTRLFRLGQYRFDTQG